MAADDLATQGARTSATMVLTWLSRNISSPAPEGLILQMTGCITLCDSSHPEWFHVSTRLNSPVYQIDSHWVVFLNEASHDLTFLHSAFCLLELKLPVSFTCHVVLIFPCTLTSKESSRQHKRHFPSEICTRDGGIKCACRFPCQHEWKLHFF